MKVNRYFGENKIIENIIIENFTKNGKIYNYEVNHGYKIILPSNYIQFCWKDVKLL